MSTRPEKLKGPRPDPGRPDSRFAWGPVDMIHVVGEYQVVEYRKDMSTFLSGDYSDHGKTFFHPYVNGKDTSMSFESLDAALVGAVAYKHEGANGSAGFYFMRMITEEKA